MTNRGAAEALTVSCSAEQDWNDHVLGAPVTEPQLRLWTYRTPGVVVGAAQRGMVTEVKVRERAGAIGFAERRSGGGAVLVGPWMLSLSLALPPGHFLVQPGLMTAYRAIGETCSAVLHQLGAGTRAVPPEALLENPRISHRGALDWACFGSVSPWEVVVGPRKLVGLAQVRRRTGVLLVAGLLLEPPDWELLCRALGKPVAHAGLLAERTTFCSAECRALRDSGAVVDLLSGALAHTVGISAACAAPNPQRSSTPEEQAMKVKTHEGREGAPTGMRTVDKRARLDRRTFLQGSGLTALGAAIVSAPALAVGSGDPRADSFGALEPQVGATLLKMARDIFPHDKLADRYYLDAIAPYGVKAPSDADLKTLLTRGTDDLNASARRRFGKSYVDVPAEADRVTLLKAIESTAFFQKIRGDLVTGLYNNKRLWPLFGYEGSSVEKGGYINRGFNDIDWL